MSAPKWPTSRRASGLAGVVATSSSPTPIPTAEGLETQGGHADYGAQARGRQPAQLTRRTRRDCGGRAEGPTSWGANCVVLQGLSSGAGVQAAYGCLYPSFCLSDACSDTAYRDACTIGHWSWVIRTRYVKRMMRTELAQWRQFHSFAQCRKSFIVRHL